MNLVAKEGPLVNERDGALILSEGTGAFAQLGAAALAISPCDIEGTAAAFHDALTMPPGERARRAVEWGLSGRPARGPRSGERQRCGRPGDTGGAHGRNDGGGSPLRRPPSPQQDLGGHPMERLTTTAELSGGAGQAQPPSARLPHRWWATPGWAVSYAVRDRAGRSLGTDLRVHAPAGAPLGRAGGADDRRA